MTLNQIIKLFGSRKEARLALNPPVSKVAIGQWFKDGEIPELRQRQYEEITSGQLKLNRKFRQKAI